MNQLVALDIETTGLDPANDAIIEIGLIKFKGQRIENEWSSLVHPGCRIPPFITKLTGISDQMVLNAPSIHEVLNTVEDFIGDLPVLGHNINFDISFLRHYRILDRNRLYDTYELASVLLPDANQYNLSALAASLGVPFPATHRALNDARATMGIYLKLIEKAHDLPINLLAEIIRLSDKIEWGAYWPFREVIRAHSKEIISPSSIKHSLRDKFTIENIDKSLDTLQSSKEYFPLDIEETSAMLDIGGLFSKRFPQFEHRPQQVTMCKAIAEALSEHQHLLVEAGTGIGKSIAYLLPAILWTEKNNQRIVISTNTINLQDQLIHKDIPDLMEILDSNIQATVLKGRSNYLCPRRLEILRNKCPENVDELRVLAKILVWLQFSNSGDRGEINLNGPVEKDVWMRLSAEDENCSTENCMRRMEGICPFYKAHQKAQISNIVIVNHALLLADVATGNRVLPDYEFLIIDEAHHLEDATTNALSYRVNQANIYRLLAELGGSGSGMLGQIIRTVQSDLNPAGFSNFSALIKKATDLAFQFDQLTKSFFKELRLFLDEQREGRPVGMYAHQERITSSIRIQPSWSNVEVSWDAAQNILQPLLENIAKIVKALAEIHEELTEEFELFHSSLSNIHRRLEEFLNQVNGLVFDPDPAKVYWIEIQPKFNSISINIAPLHIGDLMERYIWYEKSSAILTSATLTTMGEFDYLRGRLNAEDSNELLLGSPFDYENATLLYLVNDIPEPNDRFNYQKFVEKGLIQLSIATGGRTMVLFTSYDQLRRTSNAISNILAKKGITVYEQGIGASPHSLLQSFRKSDNSVLFGTRSFWEGVDVPGEALSVLIIVKLPFDVPTEPIVSARAGTFEDPFYQYYLPEAILRFRQGFGRLIRTQSDRGVVAIFDKRVISKSYGHLFISSLPQCTAYEGSIAELPKKALQWLNF